MQSSTQSQIANASIYSDIHSLDGLRKQAQSDSHAAIKAAAKEFEAFFMNMMLKSMRQASEVIGDDNMFGSPQEKMFTGMLDEQMSVELSQKGNLGIADLMIRDLLGPLDNSAVSPASLDTALMMPKAKSAIKRNSDSTPLEGSDVKPITSELKQVAVSISTNGTNTTDNPFKANLNKDNLNTDKLASEETNLVSRLDTNPPSNLVKPEKKSLFADAKAFVSKLLPFAEKAAAAIGVDPKIILAQAALETGWGKYVMHNENGQASHNLFGIKSSNHWQGDSVSIDTVEVENGEVVKKKQPFRMYDSFEKSFSDYVEFLHNNPRYSSALKSVKNAEEFVNKLQSAGYATDPNYAKKIIRIFRQMPSSVSNLGAH